MLQRLSFILGPLTLLLAISACSARKGETSGGKEIDYGTPEHVLQQYKLVWKDDFDGPSLDLTKWNYRFNGAIRQYAVVSSKTVTTDGKGNLVIATVKDKDGKYYVGQAGTQGIFETKFGYFECRAKVNKTIGPHTAFWLQTPDINNTGDDPKKYGAEIDIFEFHMKTPETVHHNIHWNGYTKGIHKQVGTEISYPSIKEGFHTFGLEWTDKEYIFYVDGKETWRTGEAISHRNEYIVLSAELTGFGGDYTRGVYPDSILYDYVRVYKKK